MKINKIEGKMKISKSFDNKLIVIMISLITAMLSSVLLLSIPMVSAAGECCRGPVNGVINHYCVDDYKPVMGTCTGGPIVGACSSPNVDGCEIGTCLLPKDFSCDVGKAKLVCTEELNGSFNPPASDCEDVCCVIIPTNEYGIMTRKACYEKAKDRGKADGWDETNTDKVKTYAAGSELECANNLAREIEDEKGCCVGSVGNCRYTTVAGCTANTIEIGKFCYQLDECQASNQHCEYASCGILPGDADKICSFDSQDQQEECPPTRECAQKLNHTYYASTSPVKGGDCAEPANMFVCSICDEDSCNDDKQYELNGPKVETVLDGEPYCKTTVCTFQLNGSQEIKVNPPEDMNGGREIIIKAKRVNTEQKLLNGHSICYNFFGSFIKNDEDKKAFKFEKENGAAFIFDANNKDAEYLQTLEVFEMSGVSTGLQNNKLVCERGEVKAIPYGTDRKTLCFEGAGDTTYNKTNAWEECKKCGYQNKEEMTNKWHDFIGDLFYPTWGGLVIKSWIADKTSEQCDPNECNSDFCYYDKYFGWAQNISVGSCVPIYSPGVASSEECTKGPDAYSASICKVKKCYVLGNNAFETDSGTSRLGSFLMYGTLITLIEKLSLVDTECIIASVGECIAEKGLTPAALLCFVPKVITCFGTIIKATIAPVATVVAVIWDILNPFKMLKSALDFLKSISGSV